MSLWNWIAGLFGGGEDEDRDGEFLPNQFEDIPSESMNIDDMMEWNEEHEWVDKGGNIHQYITEEPAGGELRRDFDFSEDAESYIEEIGAGASYFDIVSIPGGGYQVWYNPE